jgi:hypothetical protein
MLNTDEEKSLCKDLTAAQNLSLIEGVEMPSPEQGRRPILAEGGGLRNSGGIVDPDSLPRFLVPSTAYK